MTQTPIACPQCQRPSKKVSLETIQSLVQAEYLNAFTASTEQKQYRFCPETQCETVYFTPDHASVVLRNQMTVRIGQKETAADRPVCYCFSFSAADITANIDKSGAQSIPFLIKAQCQLGKDNCKHNNPQGTCCLGNVRAVMHAAQAISSEGSQDLPDTCCDDTSICHSASNNTNRTDHPPAPQKSARTGLFTIIGAVAAAIMASACCWLPLLLIAFGISGTAISASFEAWRPVFLPLTYIMLGAAFYFTYRTPSAQTECCTPSNAAVTTTEGCCSTPTATTTGVKRLNKIMLWPLTALILLMAFFPNYIGVFLSSGEHLQASAIAYTIAIEGMTCEACTTHVRNELLNIPGVTTADVRYSEKVAHVAIDPAHPPTPDALLQAVIRAGYTPTLVP